MKFLTRAIVTLCAVALASPATSLAAEAPGGTHLDIRMSVAVDLYQYVRQQAALEEPTSPEGFAPAIEAARRVKEKLDGASVGWGLLDGTILDCELAEDVLQRFRELPEELALRSGTDLRIRDEAVVFGEALVAVQPLFRQKVWPSHRSAVELARRRIEEVLFPKQREALQFMLQSLGMRDPEQSIPVYLVYEAPWPGAMTSRRPDGGGVSFVSVRDEEETILFEMILHEATHALDTAVEGDNVLDALRERLRKVGVDRQNRLFRDVPHTIMFIQAGETIRRLVDPEHVHYGEARGYYPKVERVAEVELPIWKAHLDGQLGREAALSRIVDEVLDPATSP